MYHRSEQHGANTALAVAEGAVYGAIVMAATGAIGAAVLSTVGFPGFAAWEAARMGAIGGSMLGGVSGFFGSRERHRPARIGGSVVGSIVGGLIGYGVLNAVAPTAMNLAGTALAFAVGTPIVGVAILLAALTVVVALACCCIPVAAAAHAANTPRLM